MFENAKPVSASYRPPTRGVRPASVRAPERYESLGPRRTGEALRAVGWSEITARLNAARDLRLLLRNESHAPIEMAAASFGDAAASYFALLDDSEPGVNLDTLEQSKGLGAMKEDHEANRQGDAAVGSTDAGQGDAREMQ